MISPSFHVLDPSTIDRILFIHILYYRVGPVIPPEYFQPRDLVGPNTTVRPAQGSDGNAVVVKGLLSGRPGQADEAVLPAMIRDSSIPSFIFLHSVTSRLVHIVIMK